MPRDHWLEFHDSTMLAVQADSMRASIELDGYIHRWEGSGPSRRGSGWTQGICLELDFPIIEGKLATLPVRLSYGRAVSKSLPARDEGTLTVPVSINRSTVLELKTASGERLKILGKRFRARATGKARYVERLPKDMDPERSAN
jgi:hypothetical protein